MAHLNSRYQVACLGVGGIGKTSIMKRYLDESYSAVYKETVEETYIQAYNINGVRKHIDFIDTAGSIYFPAMQKIYIERAKGFILVYSVNHAKSFEEVKRIWEQIKSVREGSIRSIPCVVVGNKLDLENNREVETFDAMAWAHSENLAGFLLEVSAKDDIGIRTVFDSLLEQIGNTRSQQTEPLRMRATTFCRQQFEADIIRKRARSRGQKKILIYDKIIPSCKQFRDSVFENFNNQKIYRVIPQQKNDTHQRRSCSDFGLTLVSNLRRVSDSGRKLIISRSSSLPSEKKDSIDQCKLSDYNLLATISEPMNDYVKPSKPRLSLKLNKCRLSWLYKRIRKHLANRSN
ncbi:unnamed protein product [Mytilus coruscus]|uniref:DIRAS2 n=1 Tax=Mytilus coruscus TaxID=42192 RepID=A0A6J8CUF6_MYTCO|nr:unnamed protein product [Mytilus coruscus]